MLLPNDGIQKNAELMGIYPLHGVKDDYIVVLEDVFFSPSKSAPLALQTMSFSLAHFPPGTSSWASCDC